MRAITVSRCFVLVAFVLLIQEVAAVRADNSTPTTAGPTYYTLRYKFAPGQVLKYALSVDTNSSIPEGGQSTSFNTHVDSDFTQSVQTVSAIDGSATIQSSIDHISGTLNGQPMPMSGASSTLSKPMTSTVTTTGSVLNMTAMPGGEGIDALAGANPSRWSPTLPLLPVKIGDTWTGTFPMPGVNLMLSTVMTLASVQNVDGANVADVDVKYTFTKSASADPVPADAPDISNMTGESTIYFDIDAGEAKRMTTNMSLDLSPPKNQNAPDIGLIHTLMVMKMTLLQ